MRASSYMFRGAFTQVQVTVEVVAEWKEIENSFLISIYMSLFGSKIRLFKKKMSNLMITCRFVLKIG